MHVFVYGSLMSEKVWSIVVSKSYAKAWATLNGFTRKRIEDKVYPAIFEEEGSSVRGIVYFNISEEDLENLDAFEGKDYSRKTVKAIDEDGAEIMCETYTANAALRNKCLSEDWDFNEFIQNDLLFFLEKYGGWSWINK